MVPFTSNCCAETNMVLIQKNASSNSFLFMGIDEELEFMGNENADSTFALSAFYQES